MSKGRDTVTRYKWIQTDIGNIQSARFFKKFWSNFKKKSYWFNARDIPPKINPNQMNIILLGSGRNETKLSFVTRIRPISRGVKVFYGFKERRFAVYLNADSTFDVHE